MSVAAASVQQHFERDEQDTDTESEDSEDEITDEITDRTMNQRNGVKRREIWKEDLNSNECIVQLATELNKVASEYGLQKIWAQSDGSPHYALRKLVDTYPDQFNKIRFFGGPFHFTLEAWRGIGRLFGDVFLGALLSGYRDTERKRKWFLNPGDPRQTQNETPQILHGLYMAAALSFRRQNGQSGTTAAVWQYMLQRAREEPLVCVVVMYIMFAEAALCIVDSEKATPTCPRGDFELYRSAHRLMLLLWSTTNSYRYMRTTLDQEVEWRTASKREMKINEDVLFTKETVNGKRIFGDTFVEWSVNRIRQFDGKYDRQGLDNRLFATVKLLDDKERMKVNAQGRQKPQFGDRVYESKMIQFSDVHLASLCFAERTRLFDLGHPLRHWRMKGVPGPEIARGAGLSIPVSGTPVPLSEDIIKLLDTAEARITSSLHSYYLPQKMRAASRPDEQNKRFRTVQALSSNKHKHNYFQWAAQWSTNVEELKTLKDGSTKAVNDPNALQELYRWVDRFQTQIQNLPSHDEIRSLRGSEQIKAALANVRQLVFAHGEIERPPPPSRESTGIHISSLDEAMAHALFVCPQ